jgi:hypothetical protein
MKSGKQRRAEIKAKRERRAAQLKAIARTGDHFIRSVLGPPVNEDLLAANNNYGAPDFDRRGYYVDKPFRCFDCGKEEVRTGTQRKWWYEVAKEFAYSTAVRRRSCRRKKREPSAESRRVHHEGIERNKHERSIQVRVTNLSLGKSRVREI